MKKFVITMSLATTLLGGFAIGYHAHDYRQEAEVQEEIQQERKVEYEVVKVEGDVYTGASNEHDSHGMIKGLEFIRQQVGKKLELGDKVVAYWDGDRLKAVVPK